MNLTILQHLQYQNLKLTYNLYVDANYYPFCFYIKIKLYNRQNQTIRIPIIDGGRTMFVKDKKKFKREDFIFENGWFQSIVKLPGSLSMQQFNISDCEECEIYIFDSNAAVYVDDCKYCTIFVGPSQSSLFIRDCHYLTVVSITQQFRLRDCTHSRFWIWCESQPIIQSSHHVTLSCYPPSIGYDALLAQMKQSKLKLWNNNWFDIYDFTPTKFSMQNFMCVQTKPQQVQILNKFSNKIKQQNLKQKKQIIPLSLGTSYANSQGINSYIVLVIFPVPDGGVGLPILHSRTLKCPEQLRSHIQEDFPNGVALFVKIKNGDKDKWERASESGWKIVGCISEQKGKQILESTVFVPFADER